MKFDFTKGKPEKYMVFIYMPDGCYDQLYYHYYKEAKAKFEYLKNCGFYERGTIISLRDIKSDKIKERVTI